MQRLTCHSRSQNNGIYALRQLNEKEARIRTVNERVNSGLTSHKQQNYMETEPHPQDRRSGGSILRPLVCSPAHYPLHYCRS